MGPYQYILSIKKKGYGEQLINYTLENAKRLGYRYIVIFGDPDYYKKFGFVSAIHLGVYIEGQEENSELDFVLIKDLDQVGQISIKNGPWLYRVPDGYEVDENELIEFEKDFPEKKKNYNKVI